MGMEWKNRAKKILAEALVAGLLLIPAVLSPTGVGEGSLPGNVMVGQPGQMEQPENGDEGENGVVPCGDGVDEDLIDMFE